MCLRWSEHHGAVGSRGHHRMAVTTLLSLPAGLILSHFLFPKKTPRNPKPQPQSGISHEFADAVCATSYLFLIILLE